jgi:hypothetical protein
MKLKANDAAQKIPVSILYKDVQANKIDPTNWEYFISLAFAKP